MAAAEPAHRAWSALASLFLSNEQHDRFHEVCGALGLPHPGALKLLLQLGGVETPPTMGDVARMLNCDASYVTSLVDALEDPGLAERRVSARDRRVKTIHLTDAGIAARDRAHAMLSEPPPRLGRLSASEVRALADLLEKLVDE